MAQEEALLFTTLYAVAELCPLVCHQQSRVNGEAGHVQCKLTVWFPRGEPAYDMTGDINYWSLIAQVASEADWPHRHTTRRSHLSQKYTRANVSFMAIFGLIRLDSWLVYSSE